MFSSFQIPFSLKIASACVLEKSVTSTLRLNIFIRLGRVDDDQILFRIVSLFDDVGYGYYIEEEKGCIVGQPLLTGLYKRS